MRSILNCKDCVAMINASIVNGKNRIMIEDEAAKAKSCIASEHGVHLNLISSGCPVRYRVMRLADALRRVHDF